MDVAAGAVRHRPAVGALTVVGETTALPSPEFRDGAVRVVRETG